jgi:hypothetical protein
MFGYEPRLVVEPTTSTPTYVPIAEMVEHREQHLQSLKTHLARALNKMKQFADKKHGDF